MRPDLSAWEPTLGTVHAYAKIPGTIRRNMVDPLPHWEHASLVVTTDGLSSGLLPKDLEITIDHTDHRLVLRQRGDELASAPLDAGFTATELGRRAAGWLRDCGVETVFEAERWENDAPRLYEPAAAQAGHAAQREAADMFAALASRIYPWEVSPVALWPHHFDVSVAVIGTRRVPYDDGGTPASSPSQIGCGFSPPDGNVDTPYLYATPWPFPDGLADVELPGAARWTSAGFEGAVLRYRDVESAADAGAFFDAVFDEAAPLILM